MPDNVLKRYSADVKYDYGFQENPGDSWFQNSPYMLIQVNDTQRMKEGEFRDTDKVIRDLEKEMERMMYDNNFPLKNYSVENVKYDDENKILYTALTMVQTDNSPFVIRSAMLLTEKGYIQFLFFIGNQDADYYSDVFDQIITHIHLDKNMVFIPRISDHFMFIQKWKDNLFSSPKNGFIFLFICLGIWWSREKLFGIK